VVTDYHVRFTEKAIKDLGRLDKPVAQRILDKIKWLALNMEVANPEPLQHGLKGKCKLRVGDWRVVYELEVRERELAVLYIDHRSRVYK